MAKRNPSTPKAPAFQFYSGDFLSDAKQAAMTLVEVGAYVRLMAFDWASGGKGIPDNPQVCARLIGADSETMSAIWLSVRACFESGPSDGMMRHPRLVRERAKQRKYSLAMQLNGRRGGRPRLSDGKAAALPQLNRGLTEKSSSSSSSSSSSEVQDPARARGAFDGKRKTVKASNPSYSAMRAWMAECHELHGDSCANQREHAAKLRKAEAS